MNWQAPHERQQPQLQPPQPAQAMQALQPPMAQPLQPPPPLHPTPTLQPPPPALQPATPALQPATPALQPPALQPIWAYCTPARSASLSKTKNVPKLTSKISSSSRINCGCGAVSRKGISGAGPTAPVAAPCIAMDTPTTPATGTAL